MKKRKIVSFTNRKIKPCKYKGFQITFSEVLVSGKKTNVTACYISPRHKETVFTAKASDENRAFEKIKKIIDKKEKGKISKFSKPYCYECTTYLNEKNLYPYTHLIFKGKKKYFCKECTRRDMMIPKKEFEKQFISDKKYNDQKAVILGSRIIWKKINMNIGDRVFDL